MPRKKFIIGWLAAILAIGFVLIGVAALLSPQTFLCVDSGNVSGDVLIVLGGGVKDRPEFAATLYEQHAAPLILLSGAGDTTLNRRVLRQNGVPKDAIEMENRSLTTRENAIYSIPLLRAAHIHRAIIVTSWYHSRRALKTFQHYAPDITFYSRPAYFEMQHAGWSRNNTSHRMRLEFLKLIGYWGFYGINPF